MRKVHPGRCRPTRANLVSEGSKTVLVVDGKLPLRKSRVEVLRQCGYRVLEASGALAAQRLADSHQNVRLVLTDFSTPEITGLELARWFQARFPKTKILITTDSLSELFYQTGEHEQFGILVKPFSSDELRRMVQLLEIEAE